MIRSGAWVAAANAEALRTLLEVGESMTGTPWSEQFGVDGTTITARHTVRGVADGRVSDPVQRRYSRHSELTR